MLPIIMLYYLIKLAVTAQAWGPDGHSIAAEIAQRLLSEDALLFISSVLKGQSMAEVSNWADEIRNTPYGQWSGPLHFADLPDRNCTFLTSRDCPDGFCVSGAIRNYSQRLIDPAKFETHAEDLKFLVHFVADAHQPLHAGFKSDRGGNSIQVDTCFEHMSTCHRDNLHSVWDSVILKEGEKIAGITLGAAWRNFAEKLVNTLGTEEWRMTVDAWKSSCSEDPQSCAIDIVTESARYACDSAYIDAEGNWIRENEHLNKDYYEARIDLIEQRLMAAGVRLASLLDWISKRERGIHPERIFSKTG